MGTGSFPGVKCGRGVLMTTHPLLVPRPWKSRATPLPTLWTTTGPVTGNLPLPLMVQNTYVRVDVNTLLDGIAKGTKPGIVCPCVLAEMSDSH